MTGCLGLYLQISIGAGLSQSTLYVMWSKIASPNLFGSLSWCTCAGEFDRCTQTYHVLSIEFGKHTGDICLSLNLLKNDYTVAVCTLTRMIFDIGSMQYVMVVILQEIYTDSYRYK